MLNYTVELNKATANISLENAKKLASELRASIEARDNNRICACGTPCRNYHSHNAIDQLALIAVEK
jgi:hypothetical protein